MVRMSQKRRKRKNTNGKPAFRSNKEETPMWERKEYRAYLGKLSGNLAPEELLSFSSYALPVVGVIVIRGGLVPLGV